jgi:hypothetical protein
MCDTIKKIFKVVGILAAIAAAVAGIYYLVTKVIPCKSSVDDDDESDYVSCSCCDIDDPVQVDAK